MSTILPNLTEPAVIRRSTIYPTFIEFEGEQKALRRLQMCKTRHCPTQVCEESEYCSLCAEVERVNERFK